jgi:hypothetical protein
LHERSSFARSRPHTRAGRCHIAIRNAENQRDTLLVHHRLGWMRRSLTLPADGLRPTGLQLDVGVLTNGELNVPGGGDVGLSSAACASPQATRPRHRMLRAAARMSCAAPMRAPRLGCLPPVGREAHKAGRIDSVDGRRRRPPPPPPASLQTGRCVRQKPVGRRRAGSPRKVLATMRTADCALQRAGHAQPYRTPISHRPCSIAQHYRTLTPC